MSRKEDKVLKIVEKEGMITPKEIEKRNISRQYIYQLYRKGKLEKVSRGLYKLANSLFSQNEMLIAVANSIPAATICLLTALRFHDMTVQNSYRIWISIHHKSHSPRASIPLKIIRMTGKSLTEGREEYVIDNTKIFVYNPAKTVADCFKFRNKIGIDVALEALREFIDQKKGTIDELWRYAKIDRVQNIIRPYLEVQL
ncbi:type IV toxin-antitoxin system AbiEi family antitoxin domain-containing protein [bacterium]|nr:type IV toxin-antitoxin system AbiEi family antitoxin domain-containing protein [bacterium]